MSTQPIKIKDGIIHEDTFGQDNYPRMLFFLKEAYTSNPDGFDLTEYLRDDKYELPRMWKNAASWACLFTDPTVAKEKKKSKLKEAMAHCAVVNIKKENGTSNSSHADLAAHFEKNKSDLFIQIKDIKPQIIITGGTYRYLVQLFEGITPVAGGELEDNIGFYQTADKKTLIVRLRHPSFPKATSDEYYKLIQSRYQKIYAEVKMW
jgi:hypothetical protein